MEPRHHAAAPLNHGDTFSVKFGGEATYGYHCNFHPEMQGTVIVSNMAASASASVLIDNGPPEVFNPASVQVQPGGTVQWYYPPGPPGEMTQHTVTENGGGLPSYCLNGRSFVGNTPTIVAHAGQNINGYHSSAILLTDGGVLMGGDPADATGQPTPHERFFPGYCFLPRPTIASAPGTVGYGATFAVNTADALIIAEVVLMRPGAVTHGFNQTQRYVGCAFTAAPGALSVTTPTDRNLAPPGWYMLFIVNAGRVPSVASWIRLH